jgi:hypothetical protein
MIRVLYSVYAYEVSYVKTRAYDSKNIIRMIRMLELCIQVMNCAASLTLSACMLMRLRLVGSRSYMPQMTGL